MKQKSAARAIAVAALFTSHLAGCSSTWETEEDLASSAVGGGIAGSTGSGGGGNDVDCYQYRLMTSESTPSDQQALLEQNMRRMTPAMRDRHMSEMRKMC